MPPGLSGSPGAQDPRMPGGDWGPQGTNPPPGAVIPDPRMPGGDWGPQGTNPPPGAVIPGSSGGGGGYIPPTGPGGIGVRPEDLPYMQETRDIRTGQPLRANPNYINNLDFWNQLPTWQQGWMKNLQGHSGVAAEDWAAQASRDRLGGLGRQSIGLSY